MTGTDARADLAHKNAPGELELDEGMITQEKTKVNASSVSTSTDTGYEQQEELTDDIIERIKARWEPIDEDEGIPVVFESPMVGDDNVHGQLGLCHKDEYGWRYVNASLSVRGRRSTGYTVFEDMGGLTLTDLHRLRDVAAQLIAQWEQAVPAVATTVTGGSTL